MLTKRHKGSPQDAGHATDRMPQRKNKKKIHKELQDLDPIGSPHLEEILIGGKIDLDILSLFPQ
jgi:hypothetical protein